MQIQRNFDSKIKKYELYTKRASNLRERNRIKLSKTKRAIAISSMVLIVVVMLAFSVGALNFVFDSSVFSQTPSYSLTPQGYSSLNSAFSNISPEVTLSIINRGGERLILSSKAVELGKVLDSQNISIDETCVLSHSLDTIVYDGMNVVIDSITYEDVSVTSSIPYDVKTIELRTIPKGKTNILTNGVCGTESTVYRRKFVNGVFESEELISSTLVTPPVTEVIQQGVGGTFVGGDGQVYSYSYYIDVVATCYGQADGSTGTVTATGTQAREGVIAVDPDTIALGTKVYVTSDYRDLGVCYAEDTGGFIKGNRIDVYLNGTLQQLLDFGRRDMRVYILE